ncbi:MAG TPA: hypothetical protein DCY84_01615, partial [Firmicutes bacterium]|nr:hypothetical protein [Bacillota bacterium]
LAFPKIREALSNKAPDDRTSAAITMRKTSKTYQYDNTEIMKLTIDYPEITSANSPEAAEHINEEIALQVDAFAKNAD